MVRILYRYVAVKVTLGESIESFHIIFFLFPQRNWSIINILLMHENMSISKLQKISSQPCSCVRAWRELIGKNFLWVTFYFPPQVEASIIEIRNTSYSFKISWEISEPCMENVNKLFFRKKSRFHRDQNLPEMFDLITFILLN